MGAERVLILHQGDDLDVGEIRGLVESVERESGGDLTGTRLTTYPAGEPTEGVAEALVLRLEGDGEVSPGSLSRTGTYTYEVSGGRSVVVAVVWAGEVNGWVRRVVPQQMGKVEATGMALTRRPGWRRLAEEGAVAFVAEARDGVGRRFGEDVHVVVSVLPRAKPRQIRRLMPGGYIQWVDGVFRRAGAPLGRIDVAHWLVCVDGSARVLHLAYLSADRSVMALLPWELLSRAERRGGRKLA
ncbi:hypothetical protein [Streptomyces lomondensis]|uniref:Uncharacterized protein n=1 Tax=Streptomyces lomondensis TaxID=68229 RepID=A0ABQ2XDV0_9ACTN|nr:hypothetical protein [Streptomyces lomondensis]MCF0077745.1 hypothetical protein [Streptomyces lomondensis]GGX12774.1 hypothetical protein GCM10010383_48450 [Streptomyces lomondensis]